MAGVQITRRYPWQPADAGAVVPALEELGRAVVGADAVFSGSSEPLDEKGVTLRFESAAEFLPHAATAGRFGLRAGGYGAGDAAVSFGRFSSEDAPELEVSVPAERKAEALAAIDRFEHATGLAPRGVEEAGTQPEVRLRRRYDGTNVALDALIDRFVEHIGPLTGAAPVEAVVETLEPAPREIRFPDLGKLRAAWPQPLAQLRLRAYARAPSGGSSALSLDRRRRPEIRLEVTVAQEREALAGSALAAFQSAVGLAPLPEESDESARRGLEVTCFARRALSPEWLEALRQALLREEPYVRGSSGRLELRGQAGPHTFGDAALLMTEAAAAWSELLVLRLDSYGESRTIFVTVEPKLDLVRLEVKADDEAGARASIERLERALDLEQHPGRAYDTMRSRRSYRFRSFDRTTFADAVAVLIQDFVGRDPIVWEKDSYVAQADRDGNWALTRYSRLDPFVTRLRGDESFVEAKLVAAGPQDRVVSLLLTEDRRLEVRSSFEQGRFHDLVREIEKRLPVTADPGAEAAGAPKSTWQRVRDLDGIHGKAVVGLAVVLSSVVTWAVSRLTAQDTLALIAPASADGRTAAVSAGCVPIEWEVRGRGLWDDAPVVLREQATLQIDSGSGRRLPALEGFRSGDELFLPVGDWSVYVYDAKRARRSPTLMITATRGPSTPAGGPSQPERCHAGP